MAIIPRPRISIRSLSLVLLSWALSLPGCVFFEVPRQSGIDRAEPIVPWLNGALEEEFPDPDSLRKALKSEFKHFNVKKAELRGRSLSQGPLSKSMAGSLVAEFLHLSDAQIRDENLYASPDWRAKLLTYDTYINSSIRHPFVERYDSFTLAAFLIVHGKESSAYGPPMRRPFVVHTGDLIDISVSTELIDSLSILRAFRCEYEIYSVAGNHDGLTFGNLRDRWTDTRGLGINRSEFVLGHLLYGSPEGFGFESNEIVRRFNSCARGIGKKVPKIRWWHFCNKWLPEGNPCWWDRVHKQTDDVLEAAEYRDDPMASRQQNMPLLFRNSIHVSGEADKRSLRLGYYSFVREVPGVEKPGGIKEIRLIVLDTRMSFSADGDIDDVQMGWLYNELSDALRRGQPVIIFGHHAPNDMIMRLDRTATFYTMLEKFPNIVAYFHGHSHWNEEHEFKRPWIAHELKHWIRVVDLLHLKPIPAYLKNRYLRKEPHRFPVIQTGSLADFPQVGRRVWIYSKPVGGTTHEHEVTIYWEFVRPMGKKSSPLGRVAEAALDASRRDSKKEHNKHLGRKVGSLKTKGKCGLRKLIPFVADCYGWHRSDKITYWTEWRKENLHPRKEQVRINLDGNRIPAPEAIFKFDVRDLDEKRERLNLTPVAGRFCKAVEVRTAKDPRPGLDPGDRCAASGDASSFGERRAKAGLE